MKNQLKITTRNPAELTPYHRNARIHTDAHVSQISKSIEAYGFTNPVLINADGTILAGHGRVLAALLLGLKTIPVIVISHLSKLEQRALILADNKIAEKSSWDPDILKLELSDLAFDDTGLDLSLTGFEAAEIDMILGADHPSETPVHSAKSLEPINDAPPTTHIGDNWGLGPHRVLCGDCAKRPLWDRLMYGAQAQMMFTDPPYNVPIDGHVTGKGKHKHREFVQASGEMSKPEFTSFLQKALLAMASVSVEGSLHYICMDWRHTGELLEAGGQVYTELKNICVWAKTNSGMGSLYRSRHEFITVYKKGTARHINNIQLGRFGRNRSNVWDYAGVNTFSKTRDQDLADHPTVKPLDMVKDAILDVTNIGDIVIDGFLGSGTTLLAAEACRRICYGMEIDPVYVDVILRRFVEQTGVEPILLDTGEPLSIVQVRRLGLSTSEEV